MDSAACTARCPVEDGGGGGGGGGGGATGLGGAVGAGTVGRGRLVVGTGVAGVFGCSAAIFVAGAEASLDDVPPDARCKCRETGASKGGSGGGGWLGKLLGK